MNIKIVVVTHKQYKMPSDKELYLPVQSGAAIYPDLGIQKDDEGDNISTKNPSYNELCPTYWAWKNLKADYIGVCHYRRLFSNDCKNHTEESYILTMDKAKELCSQHDVIFPIPKKYPTTYRTHYINSINAYKEIHEKDMLALEQAVQEVAPQYSDACSTVLNSKSCHLLNMFIMRYDLFCEFCEFKYSILRRAEELLAERPDKDRFCAALGEFITDIWIEGKNINYYELGLVELEKEAFLNRVARFVKKKFA